MQSDGERVEGHPKASWVHPGGDGGRLGISQSYYVVLERGRRRMSEDLGTRALSIRREPVEWKWFEYGYDVGRDLAGGLPRGYEDG